MAMRHARLTVFTGAMIALGLMHVMSAFFGYATTIIPRVYTYYLSSFLFAVSFKSLMIFTFAIC
jgi:putative Ca2+/H+ antiporter (TMEM165/GDT1 family)